MKIGILYPRISHYREEFFQEIMKIHNLDFYLYESQENSKKENFKNSNIKSYYLKTFEIAKKIRLVNIIPLLKHKYEIVILIAEMRSISVWLLLFYYKMMGTKVILWGHGISIHTYEKESKKLNPIRVLFHKLANHNWLYTHKEVEIWEKYIPKDKFTPLNNTINIEEILDNGINYNKEHLKNKYNIHTEINFIFAARFSNPYRRTDLISKLLDKLDNKKYGFIIIGDGNLKPDFSEYKNIYDFGAVYERDIKDELFNIADLYFQPAWMGLSTNEALAYGKMVLTFERSEEFKQCVELAYLNKNNSYIANNFEEMISFINSLDEEKINYFSKNAKDYASEHLRMSTMVNNALRSLEYLKGDK